MKKDGAKTLAFRKIKPPFLLFNILWLATTFPSATQASSSCEIGDETTGYWATVGAPYQGECIIPGPPDSSTGISGFRIEGKYKVITSLSGKGFYRYQPTCEPECLTGLAERHCTEAYGRYGYESDGQNCLSPDWNNDGDPDNYACFTDANRVTLYEWQWFSDDCNSLEKPNEDLGKPCPPVPVS